MNAQFFIFPYTQNSKGAIDLAAELGGKRILREGSSYKPKDGHVIINWGASDCPYKQALNRDNSAVLDKLAFFRRLKGKGLTPAYAESLADAKKLQYPVFCRTKIKGRDGAGIKIADNQDGLVVAPLYTQGVAKTSEYRIHVGRLPNGEITIIGGQKKIKKAKTDDMTNVPEDGRIWCGDTTAFVWKVHGVPAPIPGAVLSVVKQAFGYFPELTFGAFDVCYDNSAGTAYVIEINSAPMSTPETMHRYGDFFRRFLQGETQPEAVPQPVAPTPVAGSPAPSLTVQDVMNDLNYERISLKTIIEGYIQSCQTGS